MFSIVQKKEHFPMYLELMCMKGLTSPSFALIKIVFISFHLQKEDKFRH